MEMQIDRYSNILTKDEWDTCFNEYLTRPQWKYGWYSDENSPHRYWAMNLCEDAFFTELMFDRINHLVGKKHSLHRVYAGGNTFGTQGSLHTDGGPDQDKDKAYSFLYYASPDVWHPDWGGKTAWGLNGMRHYEEFRPNCGVYFKSDIPHFGEPTTKSFTGLRICVAFKLILEE